VKKLFTLLFYYSLAFSAIAQVPEVSEYNVHSCQKHLHLKSVQADYNPVDVYYTQAFWTIDPSQYYISGHVNHWFKPVSNALTFVDFDLKSSLIVDSVMRGNLKIDFVRTDEKVMVEYPNTLTGSDSVRIYYHGQPFNSGFGSFEQSTHAGAPIVWTLSEPYGCQDWWPVRQNLADKTDSIDIFISSPEQYRGASNGLLIADVATNGWRTAHWKHRYPIAAYLVAIAVTNYSVYSDYIPYGDNDSLLMLNYVFPENLSTAQNGTKALIPALQLFNNKYMLYPFINEKYGHAQFGWGGGMEHQTMTFVSSFGLSLLSHELAHQWFGDYITCGSWQDIWLNEGFATYSDGLVVEAGMQSYSFNDWKRSLINNITSQSTGSVYVLDTASVDRIFSSRLSYNKGAMVLHMLRTQVGDTSFFKGIRNYLHDEDLANGFALTAHLREHMEVAGDTTLTEFFNDWIYGQGYPTYNIQWWVSGTQLKVTILQNQSHSSVNYFEMKVPIRVQAPGLDSVLWLHNTSAGQQYTINLNVAVEQVNFDPNSDLVAKGSISKVTGLDDIANNLIILINNHELQIEMHGQARLEEWKIIDMNGKSLISGVNRTMPTDSFLIPLHQFSEGFYILQAKVGGEQISKKFYLK